MSHCVTAIVLTCLVAIARLRTAARKLHDSIRNERYLVGRHLRNFEDAETAAQQLVVFGASDGEQAAAGQDSRRLSTDSGDADAFHTADEAAAAEFVPPPRQQASFGEEAAAGSSIAAAAGGHEKVE